LKHGETRNNRMICHARPREISVWFAKNSETLSDVQPAWSGFLEETYREIYCTHCNKWIKCMGLRGALIWMQFHADGTCSKTKTTQEQMGA
jgi:hypothetical protein